MSTLIVSIYLLFEIFMETGLGGDGRVPHKYIPPPATHDRSMEVCLDIRLWQCGKWQTVVGGQCCPLCHRVALDHLHSSQILQHFWLYNLLALLL